MDLRSQVGGRFHLVDAKRITGRVNIHWTQNGTIDFPQKDIVVTHPKMDLEWPGVTPVFRTREQHICCSLLPAWLVVITSIWIVCCTDALQLPDWRLAFQSTDLKSILCVGWTWIVLPRRNRLWTDPIFWNFVIVLKHGNPTNKQCTIYPIFTMAERYLRPFPH